MMCSTASRLLATLRSYSRCDLPFCRGDYGASSGMKRRYLPLLSLGRRQTWKNATNTVLKNRRNLQVPARNPEVHLW
jgi:hypothetical protein